jgi:hypothetical protein
MAPIKSSFPFLAISLLAYGGMAAVHAQYGTLRAGATPLTLAWYGLALAGYAAAVVWAERRRAFWPAALWGGAIAFRLLLLFTTPTLSDDVYRYLWDGHVTAHGVNPYAYAIDSSALDYLDSPARALANHRWMASPYLPAAQLLFWAMAILFPPESLPVQAAMILVDLLTAALLAHLLRRAGLPPYRLLLYLWHPLVVVEVAHGAHLDAWMTLLMLLAVWLTFSPKPGNLSTWGAPAALAAATLTKFLPALLLPALLWRWRWSQRGLYAALVTAALLPFGLTAGWGLTGPLDGMGLFGAMRVYADQWNFNSGLFHGLEVGLLPWLGVTNPTLWTKRLMGLALLGTLAVMWRLTPHAPTLRASLRGLAVPFMAYLLLTPTVHPWYALPALAFVPFLPPAAGEANRRWLTALPWLYLGAALPLSYLTYLDPLDFRELAWVRLAQWLPLWGLLGVWAIGMVSKNQKDSQ